jgi:hypothetical protein
MESNPPIPFSINICELEVGAFLGSAFLNIHHIKITTAIVVIVAYIKTQN